MRDFFIALALLGTALYLALLSEAAVRKGEASLGILFSIVALLLALITAVTIVPRIARRVKFNSWWLPISFSVTREGAIYILAIFLLSLAAINSGNNLLFMILALLLSAIITSGVFARASLRSVSVSMDVPENVFVGERIAIKVLLRNRKRIFPSVSISIEGLGLKADSPAAGSGKRIPFWKKFGDRAKEEPEQPMLQHSAYFPLIRPGGSQTELVSQTFQARGRYRLEGFRVSTRFPFGFFKRGEKIRADGEVLVYPSIQPISSYFHLLPFQPGRLEGRRSGPGESLYSIRKYQDGESARHVDWKATAKTGELMTRQFAREEESKFCLILDTSVDPKSLEHGAERFEKAVSLAASLAAHFCGEGAEVEFLTPREYVPRGIGRGHFYRIMRSLAVVQPSPADRSGADDLQREFSGVVPPHTLREVLSEKVFKIILTSKTAGSFPSRIWRSSHVVYFDEL